MQQKKWKLNSIKITATFVMLLASVSFISAQKKSGEKLNSQPNILWVVCEDISPFIGCYGNTLVKTPNIDQLAKEGIRFTRAYTAAGVCAPSRSAIITGMYPTSIGTQHMRTIGDPKYQPVPSYSAVIPPEVKCFPEYLRMNGYYCTNNEKQDYQFVPPVTVWDENGPTASWKNRAQGQPFFAVFNFFFTHESLMFSHKDSLLVNPDSVTLPPYYPQTATARKDMAWLFTHIETMDKQVGELLQLLKEDGLYDNTIIFFYSDHGGNLPWMKREVLERGIHIPLIVRFPNQQYAGTINDELISSVDFAPTILSLANIPIPAYMQGQAFLGNEKAKTPRKYIFAARDRMDTEYDRVRAVHDKHYEYLYNYEPEKPYYQNIEFRKSMPVMKEWLQLRDEGKLDSLPLRWFQTKPQEELYDIDNDPHQLHNLAGNPKYKAKLEELRTAFQQWTKMYGDMGAVPEKEMIAKWWNNQSKPPLTDTPKITKTQNGVRIACGTQGTSVGYQIIKSGGQQQPVMRPVQTWDASVYFGFSHKKEMPAMPAWKVYKEGSVIELQPGDTLKINALRIGYQPATKEYIY